MKLLILLTTLLFSQLTLAGWVKLADAEANSVTEYFPRKSNCPGECVYAPSTFETAYFDVVDETEDDLTKPINSKSQAETCDDENDCQSKLSTLVCLDPDEIAIQVLDTDPKEVYCTKVTGYEQKLTGNKVLIENATKKATYLAEKAAEAAKNAGIELVRKAMECGNEVIALMSYRNALKNITIEQSKIVMAAYSNIIAYLRTGALETAASEISTVTPDGFITQGDIDALLSKINSCNL